MDDVAVAIVGAGPYGLSLAAHVRAAGIGYRQFGRPMELWRAAMPKGMRLKSQGYASNLSDPGGGHTLAAFCAETSRPYASYGRPVPVEDFTEYGLWFRQRLELPVEQTSVTRLEPAEQGFELTLADGERLRARAAVVAVGVQHFAHVPTELSDLPPELCTHASAHTDLAAFRDRRVLVVGGGQSALESAALLHENGADVTLLARAPRLSWNGPPLAPDRPLWRRLREPEAALGSGWGTWLYSNHPDWFWHLPRRTRAHRARTALGPAGANWLRSRVEGQFPVGLGSAVRSAAPAGDGVRVEVADAAGKTTELRAEHVIAATGYRADSRRLPFLPEGLRSRLHAVGGGVAVGRDYQSSVPGLFFVGPAVATSFGPVMRFVHGSAHAAHVVTDALAGAARPARRPAGIRP
ncbi:NAD(P)-binding domain-containing protein [Amycolatopsis sp. K13G38]|uniref:NAD(P)-binding domain-containing protein n=2 Tax=Amycolatopsis acididurans TaxID=2724524 RepID=A0ABX1J8G5_9PSEU|nr:NAD(P)-binding domain-containing protein [Amycolatopsis acididurans]